LESPFQTQKKLNEKNLAQEENIEEAGTGENGQKKKKRGGYQQKTKREEGVLYRPGEAGPSLGGGGSKGGEVMMGRGNAGTRNEKLRQGPKG